MRDDLGIGLGDELVAQRGKLVLQVQIIFDDAVVDDNDTARAVAMGVCIFLGRTAMRRPARMANAKGAL